MSIAPVRPSTAAKSALFVGGGRIEYPWGSNLLFIVLAPAALPYAPPPAGPFSPKRKW